MLCNMSYYLFYVCFVNYCFCSYTKVSKNFQKQANKKRQIAGLSGLLFLCRAKIEVVSAKSQHRFKRLVP